MLAFAKKYWGTIAGTGAIGAALLCGAFWIAGTTLDALTRTAAIERAENFAELLLNDQAHIDSFQSGLSRDHDLESMLRAASVAAGVRRFSLFSADGTHLFSTDMPGDGWQLRDRPGGYSNGGRLAITTDRTDTDWRIVRNTEFDVPTVIMPLGTGGTLTHMIAIDTQVGAERAGFRIGLVQAMGMLVGILVTATGIPMLFYVRRKRRVEEADERIYFLHNHDSLTNLLNRRRMQEETDRILATSRATRERTAVWYLDVDGLSEINDRLGQAGGDTVLKGIAERLAEVVDQDDLVGRIGSDDFAILLRRYTGEESLRALALRIKSACEVPIPVGSEMVRTSVSMGVALMPDHGRTFAELLKHAEYAFQYQKNVRQKDYTVFAPAMDKETHRRWTIEQLLRSALETGGFSLFFQPIVSGASAEILGFEALLRMPDGKGGFIPPSEFIPIAETRGYIKAIGTWVIEEATRQAATWPDHIFVSVNLSAVQFRDGDIVEIVRKALAAAGIQGRRLGIEVVESLLLDHNDEVLGQLSGLKELGASIDMDDFGTGYSSLGYLWRFPFDKLKIDQSFMRAFSEGGSGVSHILETIISLAHNLGLKVTAEGIETPEQATFLSHLGCDQLQGYYFGRPMPADAVAGEILSSFSARRLHKSSAPERRVVGT